MTHRCINIDALEGELIMLNQGYTQKRKENKKMRQLFLQKKMNQGLLEELLLMASKAHNTEAFLWLLEQKQALYGFEKGDMEL